jgi:hypothetical protein
VIHRKESIAYSPGQYDTHAAGRTQVHHARLSSFLHRLGVISASLTISAHSFTVPASGVYQVSSRVYTVGASIMQTTQLVQANVGDVIPLGLTTTHVVRVY